MIQQAYCEHVRRAELMPGDGRMYAWYDERCFDATRRAYRCAKLASGRLLILAMRYPSLSSVAIRAALKIEAAPAQIIQIEGGVDQNGFHTISTLMFVLPPLYPPAMPACKQFAIPVRRAPGNTSEDASIDISARIKRDTPRFTNRSLNLPVVVPSRDEQELLMGTQMDLITVVVAESIKLLVKDGWSFFKKQLAESSEKPHFIQLNLGGSIITEDQSDESTIAKAVTEAPLRLTQAQINELAGLNAKYNQLSIKKKHLLGSRAFHPVQSAEAETEIELVDQDMEKVQAKIWGFLQGSGKVGIARAEKSAG